MDLVEIHEIPKYTQYEISTLISRKIEELSDSPTSFAQRYNISEELLLDIIGERVVFNLEHYDVAGKTLNLSIDELLSSVEYSEKTFFRSGESDESTNDFVNKTRALFAEWIHQKKIFGDI